MNSDSILIANRTQLFSLIAYLDNLLPNFCEVHSLLLSQAWATRSLHKSYFISPSNNQYTAILVIKEEEMLVEKNLTQKSWLITGWSNNSEDLMKIYESLNFIDWENDMIIIFGQGFQPLPEISGFIKNTTRALENFPVYRYCIERDLALSFDSSLPDDVYVKSLDSSHAQTVYDHWAHSKTTTVQMMVNEIVDCPSAGLFLKSNDKLVCWIMSHLPAGMGRLHTLEGYRRRGYATHVAKYLSKRMAQCGYTPFVNINEWNEPSIQCFEKIGFRRVCEAFICHIEPDVGNA